MQRKAAPAATGLINDALWAQRKGGARMTTMTATTTMATMWRRQDPWDANYAPSLKTQRIIMRVALASLLSS
jgi:hypothetical protein